MNAYSQPATVLLDHSAGWDRFVSYVDGRTRSMRNFWLPIAIDDPSKSYTERTYQFGTASDPYWLDEYQASLGNIYLTDDFRERNDRIAYYSDGSRFVSKDWYLRFPQYANTALAPFPLVQLDSAGNAMPVEIPVDGSDPTVFLPESIATPGATPTALGNFSMDTIAPSSVTMPLDLSASSATSSLQSIYSGDAVFQGPTAPNDLGSYPAPTPLYSPTEISPLPSLTTGLGNLVPGVPNVPATGTVTGGAGPFTPDTWLGIPPIAFWGILAFGVFKLLK